MGTSKSYITLKTPDHTSAKRSMTYYTKGKISKETVASKFVTAFKSENNYVSSTKDSAQKSVSANSIDNFSAGIGSIVSFINAGRAHGGVASAVSQQFSGKTPKNPLELFNHLIDQSEFAGTIDATVIRLAFSETCVNLKINEIEQLDAIDMAAFSIELFANIIAISFERWYLEHVTNKVGIDLGQKYIGEIKEYILNKIRTSMSLDSLNTKLSNPEKLKTYIEQQCNEALTILEAVGGSND